MNYVNFAFQLFGALAVPRRVKFWQSFGQKFKFTQKYEIGSSPKEIPPEPDTQFCSTFCPPFPPRTIIKKTVFFGFEGIRKVTLTFNSESTSIKLWRATVEIICNQIPLKKHYQKLNRGIRPCAQKTISSWGSGALGTWAQKVFGSWGWKALGLWT